VLIYHQVFLLLKSREEYDLTLVVTLERPSMICLCVLDSGTDDCGLCILASPPSLTAPRRRV